MFFYYFIFYDYIFNNFFIFYFPLFCFPIKLLYFISYNSISYHFLSYYFLSSALCGLGEYEEAIKAIKNAIELSGRHQYTLSQLSWLHFRSDNIPEAQIVLDELILKSKTEFISALSLAVAAYSSQNYDLTFEYMEKAFEEKASLLVSINAFPFFSFIQTDPRFQPFIKRMNFPV